VGEAHTRPVVQIVPRHVRRGLARTYVAVAVPWVAWFGYQMYDTRDYWRFRAAFWSLLIVPIGGPILYVVVAWVISGFREPDSEADYESLITRAVSQLADNNPRDRQGLYDRALAALTTQLQQQSRELSASRIAKEKRALAAAVRRVEKDARTKERQKTRAMKGASTALLVFSLLFPGLWAIDFTCMSLYWVARPRR
jgi:hypothetical protein